MRTSSRDRWRHGLGVVRATLALPVWVAAHWTAVAPLYGGFYISENISPLQFWLLPVAWAGALYGGVRVAAGGGFPGPWWRAMPLAGIACLMVAGGASSHDVSYTLWAAAWMASALVAGYRHATRPRRQAGHAPIIAAVSLVVALTVLYRRATRREVDPEALA